MTESESRSGTVCSGILLGAWVIALVSSLGALFIGEVLGQTPCVLCWYQRAFMFPLAVVLGVASYRMEFAVWRYALPLAAIGGLIAAYHSALYAGVIPTPLVPCGAGSSCTDTGMTIFGGVPIPYLSLAAFIAIASLLWSVQRRTKS